MNVESRIALRLEAVEKNIGAMTVQRSLPSVRRQRVGPFVFFDHFGPVDFPPGQGMNVRAHPHIGLATISYLFDGEILHRDSLGYVQRIRPGEVNWMTAGRGIVHSEKASEAVLTSGQRLHGIQAWVALPLGQEEIEPRFEHYPAGQIPAARLEGGQVRVIIGEAYGLKSPVRSESDTLYVELMLAAGGSLPIPEAEELAIHVIEGDVTFSGEPLGRREFTVVVPGARGLLEARSDAHVILCGGGRLAGHRTVWWNFVASSPERIEQAKRDWRDGRFPPVPGEDEFIPLPGD